MEPSGTEIELVEATRWRPSLLDATSNKKRIQTRSARSARSERARIAPDHLVTSPTGDEGAGHFHHEIEDLDSKRKLLVTKGIATRSKKLLIAPGITTSNKKLLGAKGIATT